MQINIDRDSLLANLNRAKDFCSNAGVSCSVMLKDFYEQPILDTIPELIGTKLWASNTVGAFNYKIFSNDPRKHGGGIVTTIEEIEYISKVTKENKLPFEGYISLDTKDHREGLSLKNFVSLLRKSEQYNTDTVSFNNAIITSGCLHGNTMSPVELAELIWELKWEGVNKISVGGSFYLGWAMHNILPEGITEIRIGEYLLYGTIPYFDYRAEYRGKNSIKVSLEVIMQYPERKQVLLRGGQVHLDVDKSEILTQGLKFVHTSTEYTVVEYTGDIPELGSKVDIIPNYHSLIKLFR